MKALVLTDHRQLEINDVVRPEVGPEDVLIRVRACGICGSDVHGYDGSSGRRIPPVIMGHEAAGEIYEIGEMVSAWSIGDRVTFDSTIYCGKCDYCKQAKYNLCNNRRVLGVSCDEYRQDGAFAEYVAVPQRILYRLPDDVSFEQAAMVEPLSIAFHAVGLSPITINDNVVVIGAGMIGLLIVQTLKLVGCGKIIAVDIDEAKLNLAKAMGADYCINNSNTESYYAALEELTGGEGADVAIEAVGLPQTVSIGVNSIHKGGAITLVGNISPKVEIPLQNVVTRQLRLQGSCASNGEYPACIAMIAQKRVDVDSLITAVAPIEEGPVWFDHSYENPKDKTLLKVILKP